MPDEAGAKSQESSGLETGGGFLRGGASATFAAAPDPQRAYVDRILADKIRLNLAHATRATLLSDLLVILQTLGLARAG